MDNLFFRLTADKTLKRKMQLLKLLSATTQTISINQIALQMNVSRKTVISDLSILKESLPQGMEILRTKRVGVQLRWKNQLSIETHLAIMAKNSMIYRIFDSIFHGITKSITDWEIELFLSASALRKALKHYSRILKEFHLRLATNVVDLIGDEGNIRYFFYVFYREFRDLFVLQEENCQYTQILTALKDTDVLQCSYRYYEATLWLMIAKERILCKKHVALSKALIDEIAGRPAYQASRNIQRRVFKKHFSLSNLPESEFIWVYITSLHCVEYHIENIKTPVLMREDDPKLFKETHTFFHDILLQFPIEPSELNRCIYAHQALLTNIYLLSKLTPLYQKCANELKENIIQTHPELYDKWLSILKESAMGQFSHFRYPEDVSVSLSMLTACFLFRHSDDIKHILLSFRGDSSYTAYLAKTAQFIIPRHIKCTYLSDCLIDQTRIDALGVDLFISNYSDGIPITRCKILELSYIPTVPEWTALVKYILNLENLHPGRILYRDFGACQSLP